MRSDLQIGGVVGPRHRGRRGLCYLSSLLLLFPAVEELKLDLQNLLGKNLFSFISNYTSKA